MLYLLGSIVTSCILVIFFRLFQKKQIHLIQAITINYWVCVICGLIYNPNIFIEIQNLRIGVYGLGILQGLLFIFMFFQIGKASQEIGLSYTGLFGRISVIIPVGVSLFLFHEKITFLQGMGLLLALIAIYFLSTAQPNYSVKNENLLKRGFILFLGNGIIDTVFKVFTFYYSNLVSQDTFTILVFGTAGLLGTIYLVIFERSLQGKNILAGIILGIPNFFSLIFMLSSLKVIDGTKFFPLNNIGIIILLTFVGVLAFKEKINARISTGLFLTVIAIALISELITFTTI